MHPKIINVIERDVCELLRLDADAVFNLKVEYAVAYLEGRFESHIVKELMNNSRFWMWWRELWAQRDRNFMKEVTVKRWGLSYTYSLNWRDFPDYTETKNILYKGAWDFYKEFHNWKGIKYYPNQVLMNEITNV